MMDKRTDAHTERSKCREADGGGPDRQSLSLYLMTVVVIALVGAVYFRLI